MANAISLHTNAEYLIELEAALTSREACILCILTYYDFLFSFYWREESESGLSGILEDVLFVAVLRTLLAGLQSTVTPLLYGNY